MNAPYLDLPVDFRRLRACLLASDAERDLVGERLLATEALQAALWRMRREIIAAPDLFVSKLRPFGRIAELLDPRAGGSDAVLLSIRTHGARADYVQLRTSHFLEAREMVRRHGPRT